MRSVTRLLLGLKGKGKVFPHSLPSVGPGADPGVQAVSPQVAWSESRHIPFQLFHVLPRLSLLSARPAVTFVAFTRWRYPGLRGHYAETNDLWHEPFCTHDRFTATRIISRNCETTLSPVCPPEILSRAEKLRFPRRLFSFSFNYIKRKTVRRARKLTSLIIYGTTSKTKKCDKRN